ncbi:MAG: glycosyltransferase family 87 protein [Myxococcota bacterium]
MSRWTPLTRCLLIFVPVACLGVNLLLPRLPAQPQQITALDYTGTWLRRIAHEDSWKPMRLAQDWLSEPREELLYQEIFFDRGVKLQYPPTSVLFLDGLRGIGGKRWVSNEALNGISWVAVLLTVLVSSRILVRSAGGPPVDRGLRIALGLLAGATFYPLVFGFYLGQVQTWINALVAGLVLAWLVGRQATAGAISGVICLIKPQLGLLVVWALLRRRYRFAAGWSVVVGIAGLVSLGLYGLSNHIDYLGVLSYLGQHGESFNHNQSVNGLAHRLLGNGNNREWANAFPPFDGRVYAATLAASLLLIAGALFYRRRDTAPEVDLSILIVSVTIASPIVWTHHYGVFLPLFALTLPVVLETSRGRRLNLAVLAVSYLLVANNYRVVNRLFAETSVNFVQSYVFFGGLLFLGLLYRLRAPAERSPPRSA